jgi:hypothetical protein
MRTAQPLMERLNDWQQSHSNNSNNNNTSTRGQQVDNTAPLQLASHYTRTLIIRSIYRPFCTFNTRSSSSQPNSPPIEAAEKQAYTHYRLAAKSAANRFTDFAREISDRQIRAFWPFCEQIFHIPVNITLQLSSMPVLHATQLTTFTGCTGAWATMCNLWLLLHATATCDTERDECRAGLDEARNLLRLRAGSFPVLQFALLRVNSIFWKGLGEVIDPARS